MLTDHLMGMKYHLTQIPISPRPYCYTYLRYQAMGGSVPFEVALKQRLDLLQPTLQQLNDFITAEPPSLTEGVSEFISALRSRGTAVHLISGGFTDIIYPCADLLGLAHGRHHPSH